MAETPKIVSLIEGLMALGLDITKAHKTHANAAGYVELIVADQAVVTALKTVISDIGDLKTEFSSLAMSDALTLIGPVIRGVEAIVKEATSDSAPVTT